MNKLIHKIFNESLFDEKRMVEGVYYPHIPLQVYGEPMRYSFTKEQIEKFAELFVDECINAMIHYSLLEDHGDWLREKLGEKFGFENKKMKHCL